MPNGWRVEVQSACRRNSVITPNSVVLTDGDSRQIAAAISSCSSYESIEVVASDDIWTYAWRIYRPYPREARRAIAYDVEVNGGVCSECSRLIPTSNTKHSGIDIAYTSKPT